jgi:hypothetical protein
MAGDFDGDKRADLMCRDTAGNTWIAYADATGTFGARTWYTKNPSWCNGPTQTIYPSTQMDGVRGVDLLCKDSRAFFPQWSSVFADSSGQFNFSAPKVYFGVDEFPNTFRPTVDLFPRYGLPRIGGDDIPNDFRASAAGGGAQDFPNTIQGLTGGGQDFPNSFRSPGNVLLAGNFWAGALRRP